MNVGPDKKMRKVELRVGRLLYLARIVGRVGVNNGEGALTLDLDHGLAACPGEV